MVSCNIFFFSKKGLWFNFTPRIAVPNTREKSISPNSFQISWKLTLFPVENSANLEKTWTFSQNLTSFMLGKKCIFDSFSKFFLENTYHLTKSCPFLFSSRNPAIVLSNHIWSRFSSILELHRIVVLLWNDTSSNYKFYYKDCWTEQKYVVLQLLTPIMSIRLIFASERTFFFRGGQVNVRLVSFSL